MNLRSGDLRTAQSNYNRILGAGYDAHTTMLLLGRATEKPDFVDVGEVYLTRMIALGKVRSIGDLLQIRGIHTKRLSGIVEALAAVDVDGLLAELEAGGEGEEDGAGEFEETEVPGDTFEISGGGSCWCGPDAAAIGWIPYYINFGWMRASIGDNAYTRHPNAGALDTVFDSGNQPPPDSFGGADAFRRYLDDYDFRAALYIRNVKLCGCGSGERRLTYNYFTRGGYTPVRVLLAPNTKATITHCAGVEAPGIETEWGGDDVTIRLWIRFKLGGLTNFGSWVMTGEWAPWAWMQMDYIIDCSGRVRIEFRGSYIPSQSFYVGWSKVATRSMLNNNKARIDGFLTAGDCQTPPGGLHLSHPARAIPCDEDDSEA
ncbi:hypothetical protein PPSIR1_20534 [Plesiocystis pacifica SIR-1]|uniref:Uncharacterized protein n=1 Tax=Plesiocystis pacifica SIR-1 TaxID=391625 RepID=A6G283_9BACT|nr:hypothetical protein PPSIR1_20534 [Plesiocystis pacifica SIR-1]